MSVLSKPEIIKHLKAGNIVFVPSSRQVPGGPGHKKNEKSWQPEQMLPRLYRDRDLGKFTRYAREI
jgi:hypothetical protein